MPSYKNMTFEEWMVAVDYCLRRLCGMPSEWLPDYRYADEWKDGITPLTTAKRAITHAKSF